MTIGAVSLDGVQVAASVTRTLSAELSEAAKSNIVIPPSNPLNKMNEFHTEARAILAKEECENQKIGRADCIRHQRREDKEHMIFNEKYEVDLERQKERNAKRKKSTSLRMRKRNSFSSHSATSLTK